MRLLGRIVLGIFLVVVIGVLLAFGYDRYAAPRVVQDYPPQGDLLTVGEREVHAICRGDGDQTLILLHGFAGGAIDMLPLMEALPTDLHVCTFDRLSNDYSSPLPVDWTIDDVLAWHHAVIETLADGPVYVAGHSLGGAYALAYAAQYPTEGVILLDGLSPEVADSVVGRMGTYSSLTPLAGIGLLRPLSGMFVSPDYAGTGLAAQMKALRSRSQNIVGFADEGALAAEGLTTAALTDAVERLNVPLLIIVAGQTDVPEGAAFTDSLLALANNYPEATQVTVPDARHYFIVTHANLLAETMTDWIAAQ